METILWLDGHTSTIDVDEALCKSHEELTDDFDYVFVLVHHGYKFEWHNNMWMQVEEN